MPGEVLGTVWGDGWHCQIEFDWLSAHPGSPRPPIRLQQFSMSAAAMELLSI